MNKQNENLSIPQESHHQTQVNNHPGKKKTNIEIGLQYGQLNHKI